MSTPKDTLYRHLTLLQLIPRFPARIDTSTLAQKLAERGFAVDARTLQRDLKDKLSSLFPLICHDEERPYRWSFDSRAQINLPSMDTPTALAFHLAEAQLRSLLPQSVADQLNPQFLAARHYLENMEHNPLAYWSRNVRVLPNGKALQPAPIAENVWRGVSEAMLNRQQLQVNYRSRTQGNTKPFLLHPAGLVTRYSISYLLATVDGYNNIRQFALHRLQSVTVLDKPARPAPDFDIDHYINSGAFGWRQASGSGTVQLVADIHPQIAWLLGETPLSHEQQITALPDSDWQRLTATVSDDQETRWWIFGLNDNIRVHAPAAWADDIRNNLERQLARYNTPQ